MKRRAESFEGTSAKIARTERGLSEIFGTVSPDHSKLDAYKLTTLKSFCSNFHLTVGKSGRTKDGKQKYSLKRDYVEAIIRKLESFSTIISEVISDPPPICVEPLVSEMDQLSMSPHVFNPMHTMRGEDEIISVDFQVSAPRKNCKSDISMKRPSKTFQNTNIEVRVFRQAKDYRTTAVATLSYPYLSGSGFRMSDLTTSLGLKGIYQLVDPLNYRAVYCREDHIDNTVIELHLKKQGYLRLIPA